MYLSFQEYFRNLFRNILFPSFQGYIRYLSLLFPLIHPRKVIHTSFYMYLVTFLCLCVCISCHDVYCLSVCLSAKIDQAGGPETYFQLCLAL